MKLTFRPYNLQLKYPFTIANYSRTTTPVVLTQIEHKGFVGYGEASLPQYLGETQESVMQFLRRVNLKQFANPHNIEAIMRYVDSLAEGNTAAKASVDIALHDLVGKMEGKPWHRIWELDETQTPNTTYTIGIDTDDIVCKKTEEAASLFKILKVKLGGQNDKQMIETIRSVTNLPLAVDANQGWTDREEALDMIHWLKEKGVVMIEQPMDKTDLENNAWLTQHSPLPIYADESVQRLNDVDRLKDVFTGINIKLMKCTGMNEAWKMAQRAKQLGMKTMLGCMTETSCAISAASQLSPVADFADLDGNLLITNDCFAGTKIVDGKITLTRLPGIGAEPIKE
ncbi:L-alanine-DL-glutamate epimerase-like enolase superfamily enzyme [Dysgonomonas sp. PH5-37]|nr:L-alanine-DL-glutamate epimerase-like enolase superfamily enzyme [Dysgonomonas sp. PH5-37]